MGGLFLWQQIIFLGSRPVFQHLTFLSRFLSQNILERDKNRVFDFSRQNESVSLKLEGMAEKTNDDANNLEAEYEVSSDWSLSWPGSDWLIS